MKTIRMMSPIVFSLASSIIAYHVNVKAQSACPFVWACVDFFMWPFAWCKWIICQQVNVTVIKETFSALLN